MVNSFWTRGRIEEFRTAVDNAINTLELTEEQLDAVVRRHVDSPEESGSRLPSPRTISRFRKKGTHKPRPIETLTTLLHSVAKEIQNRPFLAESDKEMVKPLLDLYAAFNNSVTTSNATLDAQPATPHLRTDLDQSNILDAWLANIELPSNASGSGAEKFMARTEQLAHFLTYRFSASKGKVVKSFTVVHKSRNSVPITMFSNYRELDGQATRVSKGMVICFKNETVFLGHSENGSAVKTFIFNPITSPSQIYTGLLSTNEPSEGSVSARFLMKRSDISNHRQASTGIFRIDQIKEEIKFDELNLIRNSVKFSLEQSIFNHAGKTLPEREIVKHVDRLLTDKSELKFENGDRFNPADDFHHTYNSALKNRS